MERTTGVTTHVTPHVFRHALASNAIDRGMNIVDFEMDTKFLFKDTDINCIDLVKDSYSGISKFVDEVYRILNK